MESGSHDKKSSTLLASESHDTTRNIFRHAVGLESDPKLHRGFEA